MLLREIPFWRLLTKVDKSEDNVSLNILEKKTRIELNFGTNVHTHSCPHSFFSFCVCSRQNQTLTSAFNLVENAYIYVSNGWYQHSYFVLYIQGCSSWSVCWKDTLNFIRLLRVVITPSVTSDVVERRKRLEAIGWISGYWKEWLCQLGGVKITTVRLAHDADLIATQQILYM